MDTFYWWIVNPDLVHRITDGDQQETRCGVAIHEDGLFRNYHQAGDPVGTQYCKDCLESMRQERESA